MSTAAFIMMRGGPHEVVLLKVENDGSDRFTFLFKDPKGHAELLQVEFMTSEFREFDAGIRSLKKLCYDGKRRTGRGNKRRSTTANRR